MVSGSRIVFIDVALDKKKSCDIPNIMWHTILYVGLFLQQFTFIELIIQEFFEPHWPS